MKKSEAAEALGVCAAFDQRTVGTADVTAWALALKDLPWDESTMQAIVDFYSAAAGDYDRDSRRFIQPHHVRAGRIRIRERRIDAMDKEPVPNTVDGVSYAEELRAVRRAIADGLITTEQDAETYRQWGGSLHQTYQGGQTPQLEPSPHAKPLLSRPVDRAIGSAFPRTDLRRALPSPATRRTEPPKWATVRCPVCDAEPGALCVLPDSDPPIRRQDPHTRRLRAAYEPDNSQGLPEGPEAA